jgi:uncharacterized protein YebE (UPF0316 family)
MTDAFLSSDLFAWVILPLLIFSARICDVSMGTIRVIFISKGLKYIAPIIGFFEVIIWLLAIGQVMTHMTNVVSYIAYGGGFATGTLLGMAIEERLRIGSVIVRVITRRDATALVALLRSKQYGVTAIEAEGSRGRVKIIFMVVKRQSLPEVIRTIKESHPNAFYSIEEVKSVSEGVFPGAGKGLFSQFKDTLGVFRKSK